MKLNQISASEMSARGKKAAEAKQQTWRLKFDENVKSAAFDDLTVRETRQRIYNEQNARCALCNNDETWNGQPLKFELDHVDGNKKDNSRNNLRLLCPNCHSQTPTYRNKNNPSQGTTKVTDDEILDAVIATTSVYKALVNLGLSCHGRNYKRVRRVIRERKPDINLIDYI